MEPLDYWHLCDELSIFQAAMLIAGEDPSGSNAALEGWQPHERPPGYDAAKTAITNALKRETLEGSITPEFERDDRGKAITPIEGSVDIETSTVRVDSLRSWLEHRGLRGGFFFPKSSDVPSYLDPTHERYAPKLAATVNAWLAISEPDQLRGKTPKQALIKWLRENAARYKLSDDEGNPNELGIEECAKVANWQERGGAPRTLST